MSDASDLLEHQPLITYLSTAIAAKDWHEGDRILSLNGKATALDAFIFVLAKRNEMVGPLLLNGACARELCRLLIEAGFDPREK